MLAAIWYAVVDMDDRRMPIEFECGIIGWHPQFRYESRAICHVGGNMERCHGYCICSKEKAVALLRRIRTRGGGGRAPAMSQQGLELSKNWPCLHAAYLRTLRE